MALKGVVSPFGGTSAESEGALENSELERKNPEVGRSVGVKHSPRGTQDVQLMIMRGMGELERMALWRSRE